MGIPFYFRDLVRNHPHVLHERLPVRARRLFFDANSVIHQSAQQVVAARTPDLVGDALEARILQKVMDNVDAVVALMQPGVEVMVAVDGLCPMAKLHQQRKRRYISCWRAERLGIDTSVWDSNCITPGTRFMERLDAALSAHAKQRGYTYSGSDEAGEGEHKIFQRIRAEHGHNNGDNACGADIIYGLDADLIMLSLISPRQKQIWLLRERPQFGLPSRAGDSSKSRASDSPFLHLSIAALAESISCEHGGVSASDYVTLCILMGNDFLPPLSYLKIVDNGIHTLVKTYVSLASPGPLCDVESATLNTVAMQRLLHELAKHEDANMAHVCNAYYTRTCVRRLPQDQDVAAWELDNYPTLNKHPRVIVPGTPGWRLTYYHHLFPAGSDVTHVCDSYLAGLAWVVSYYFDYERAPKSWYYPYLYSPTLLDLSNRLMEGSGSALTVKPGVEAEYQMLLANPELQLLAVLPPASAMRLLRGACARSLISDLDKGCVHMYPRGFKITTWLKQFLWECAPVLPDVDVTYLAAQLGNGGV